MKLEIVEFYPFFPKNESNSKRKLFLGTMHVYFCDFEMDLRGIGVFYEKKNFYFYFPIKNFVDENQQKVVYPIVNFTNPSKKTEFIEFLKTSGVKYIFENHEKYLKERAVI